MLLYTRKMVGYSMRRQAKRGLHTDTNLQILQTNIKDISLKDLENSHETQHQEHNIKKLKGRGARKEGDIRNKKLSNILEDINAIKGVKLQRKKLSPIDTSLLLKH